MWLMVIDADIGGQHCLRFKQYALDTHAYKEQNIDIIVADVVEREEW
jgi:hypothetical protein